MTTIHARRKRNILYEFKLIEIGLKIFSIILQVVDLPLVPVTDMITAFLLSSKKRSKSVIILSEFFFK